MKHKPVSSTMGKMKAPMSKMMKGKGMSKMAPKRDVMGKMKK